MGVRVHAVSKIDFMRQRRGLQAPDLRAKLVKLDAQCADALRRGDIALLSMYELLRRKPEAIRGGEAPNRDFHCFGGPLKELVRRLVVI